MLASQQAVQYFAVTSETVTEIDRDTFEYSPSRGWAWLQRACFWLLGKIGAYKEQTVQVFTRTAQQNNDILKDLMGQEGEWLNLAYRQDVRIFMGPDNYEDLLRHMSKSGMSPLHLHSGMKICTPENRYGSWHDIPITVVPWLKGAAIVPDVRR